MILKALLLAIAAAAISFFITHSQLLVYQRGWVYQRSRFFGELLECCYCLSHWVMAAFMAIFPVALFGVYRPLDYALTWIALSWLAGVLALATARLWGEE